MGFDAFVRQIEEQRPASCENLVLLARVGSTNAVARRIASDCLEQCGHAPPSLVVAYEQSAGRGRRGNRWSSPGGGGVYATLVRSLLDRAVLPTLPLLAAVGLCRGLNRHLDDAPCRLKWPNDLLVAGRKIGGLLIEALAPEEGEVTALIGFGVNHRPAEGAPMPPGATSVSLAARRPPGLAELTWGLYRGLEAELAHAGEESYATAEYQALSLHRPGDRLRCRLAAEVVEGTFLGFDPRGFLRLDTGGTERLLAAGEVLPA